jgi:hypothetical protein
MLLHVPEKFAYFQCAALFQGKDPDTSQNGAAHGGPERRRFLLRTSVLKKAFMQ